MRKHEFVANLPLSLLAKKIEIGNATFRFSFPLSRAPTVSYHIEARLRSSQHMLSVRHVANCYRISLVVRYCQTRAPAELPIDKSRRDLSQFCPRGTLSVGGFFSTTGYLV